MKTIRFDREQGVGHIVLANPPHNYLDKRFCESLANAVHEAIHPLPEIAGLASAVVTTTQMLFGALGGVAAAALYHDASPLALGAIMSAAALAAAALYAFWLRGKVGA